MFVSLQAQAVLDIKITQGIEQALPIAIVPFGWSQAGSVAPVDLTRVITDDLKRSGRFDVMDDLDLPQRPTEFDAINFNDWRKLGMENILIGNLTQTENGDYDVSFRLIDVYRGKQIAGFRIPAKPNLLRRVAHQISDIVFEKLTGTAGAFDTRVAYITVKKVNDNKNAFTRCKSLMRMVTTHRYYSNPRSHCCLPPGHPTERKSPMCPLKEGTQQSMCKISLTGKRERVAAFEGINSAPDMVPRGLTIGDDLV